MNLEIIVAAGALVLSLLSLVISTWVVHLHSTAHVTSAFNDLLLVALQNDETREALYALMLPESPGDDLVKRERLIAYFILNTTQHAFLARRWRLMDRTEATPILTTLLTTLLQNPIATDALKNGHYDPRFRRHIDNL